MGFVFREEKPWQAAETIVGTVLGEHAGGHTTLPRGAEPKPTPQSEVPHEPSHLPVPQPEATRALTYAYILIIQLRRAVAVEAQATVLAVLAPRVVLAAHAGHHIQKVNVAAAVGVAVALTVCGEEERAEELGQEHPPSCWVEERSHEALEEAPAWVKCHGHCQCRAGQDECTQQPPSLTAMGGSGWKSLLREQRGVRGLCPLGMRTGRSQPLAVPGRDLLKAMHNHGSRQWLWRGLRC